MTKRGIQAWLPLVILAVMVVLLYAPLVVGNRVLFWGLPALQFYPWREFAFDELRNGQLPFWNPYNGGGAPLLANYQTALFYPPNWLYLILEPAYAMGLLAVLHLWWAGAGMWAFTGRLGVNTLGRGVSCLSFAFAGYSIARMGSFPTADAVAWMPWMFWAVLVVLEKRRWFYVGWLGLITGMLLLAGHAQSAFYILLAAGLFALWGVLVWLQALPRHQRVQGLVMTGLGVGLGVVAATTQLLFTFELLAESQRSGGVDYDTLTNLSLAPLRLVNFFTPNFFGSPVDGSYLTPGKGVYFEDAVYIGFLPLIAAGAALVGGWWQRRSLFVESRRAFQSVSFWGMLSIGGVILATGRYGPVYRWLYDHVPTFDAFREPVRWLILPVFALCVLAGIGTQAWGRGQRLFFWTRLAGAGGGAMLLLAVLIGQFNQANDDFVPVLTAALAAVGGWLAGACLLTLVQPDESQPGVLVRWQLAVLIFVAADLAWAARGLNPMINPQFYNEISLSEPHGRLYWFEDYEEQIKFEQYFDLSDYRKGVNEWPALRRSLLPNLNMLDEVPIFNNFDPLKPRYHTRYVELLEAKGATTPQLLQAAGVGQVYGDFHPAGWEAAPGEFSSYRAITEVPVAWVVPEAVWVADEATLETRLRDPVWSPAQTVFLWGSPPDTTSTDLVSITFFDVLEDSPTQKKYRVVTEGRGYLVLANTWYPGWSVKIDGRTQPLYRANLSFMAVELPPGGGEVTFRYLPTVNLLSLVISLLAVGGIGVLLAWGVLRSTEDLPAVLR